ncbi:MAG: class I SAM-dependent methyltransferase [Rhodospirillales bacterium]|nr:class I SAM-dependent methyltransferase [Rhodospirillales bacterium]
MGRPKKETKVKGRLVGDRCPVCCAPSASPFMSIKGKGYWRCEACRATFLEPKQRLESQEEYGEYRQHENNLNDPGYRKFLTKLAAPLLEKLSPNLSGLDYGCGPGPVLAQMLQEEGHSIVLYDPFFYPDPKPLNQIYDFITCTEVAEHFHHPADEFDRLGKMLKPGGILAIMTCFQNDDSKFETWHYRNDPTHVVFYRGKTFEVIAKQRGWEIEVPIKDVVLLKKTSAIS